jgi:hypothetical protein
MKLHAGVKNHDFFRLFIKQAHSITLLKLLTNGIINTGKTGYSHPFGHTGC